MNYNLNKNEIQLSFHTYHEYLMIPSHLYNFKNTDTTIGITKSNRTVYCINGILSISPEDQICPNCGNVMHVNNHFDVTLGHLCIGGNFSCVTFSRSQFYCAQCRLSKMQTIPFKANNHRITNELYQYTLDLLATNSYTLKQVAEITGLGKNTVKEIDLQRLKENYTVNGNLIKPETQARFLGIDEFKLHDGYQYATHIIDLETGHILWIAKGKKKQVVYDFIKHVGLEWMSHVEAIACDMNSDFEEAFREKCPHIKIVFDHFHITKNFNEKVVNKVRIDEEKRLKEEGNEEGAKSLKKSRYILVSKRETLRQKDKEYEEGKIISKESQLFNTPSITRKGGQEELYNRLIKENKLILTIDIVKAKLSYAYSCNTEEEMRKEIQEIIGICRGTENKHFIWFSNMLESHIEGIVTYPTYKISSGKIEGINNKIKTLRRKGYGYPDDEYFFLKLFDMSRQSYVRNQKSHKLCD